MTPVIPPVIALSSGPLPPFSTAFPWLVRLWREQYRLARRQDDPVSAVITATLSTAETWHLLRD